MTGIKRIFHINVLWQRSSGNWAREGLEKATKIEHTTMVQTLLWYIGPLVLVGITFALSPLRRWLEHCAEGSGRQAELVDEYQRNVSRFLRLSDPEKHGELREIVVWVGHHMLDGDKLIRRLVLSNRAREYSQKDEDAAEEAFEGLPEEATHAFAHALGAAFIASSYQSLLWGDKYRAMLYWLTKPDSEVKEPAQIVYRYRRTANLKPGVQRAAA